MSHAGQPDKLLEVFGDELRPVVGDDPGPCLGELLLRPLKDGFHVRFRHLLSNLPMDDIPAASVQEAAQVVEGAMDVDVGDVHMPVFMRHQRLDEPGSLERLLAIPLLEQFRLSKDAPSGGRADGDDVLVEHHEGQTAIPFEGILEVKPDDLLPLPIFQPKISRDGSIVLIGFSIPLDPSVKLALGNRYPGNEVMQSYFSFLRPLSGKINDGVASVMGNPAAS